MLSRPWQPLLVVALAAALYVPRLGTIPTYLGGDEAHFAIQAHAIASTGRDLSGHVMPLFVNLADPAGERPSSVRWYQPTLMYLIAITLEVLPFSEGSIRFPAAAIGVLDVGLMYAVGWQFFRRRTYATAAALLLALSPAHLIFSRQATDYICSLPYALAWLWGLCALDQDRRRWLPAALGLLLGTGVYSYLAAWMMMPALLFLTWVALHRLGYGRRPMLELAAGFAVPLLPLVAWLPVHPEMLHQTLGRYAGAGAAAGATFRAYWSYFDPSMLFLTGGINPTAATGRTGVFLLSAIVLLPAGAFELATRRGIVGRLVLAAMAAAPLPAALVGEPYMIQRALLMVPIGMLLAAAGVVVLMRQERMRALMLMLVLVIATALQFAYFCHDYFGHYQFRAAAYFDSGDLRTLAKYTIAADPDGRVPAIYLSRQFDDVSARWRFYATKYHREDLLARTKYYDGDGLDLGNAPVGSLMLFYANGPRVDALVQTGRWSLLATMTEPSSGGQSMILRKQS